MSEKSQMNTKLLNDKKARDSYIRATINTLVPAQIRGLRFRDNLTQMELANQAGMKQSRISTMEQPGATKFNVETLIRLAATFKVGLKIEFVSFGEMLRWENQFSQDTFDIVRIDNDREFHDPSQTVSPTAFAEVIPVPGDENERLYFFRTNDNRVYQGFEIEGVGSLEYTVDASEQQITQQDIIQQETVNA